MHYPVRMDICEAIGARVRSEREAQGISQSRFAAMVGVDQTYLSRLEQGRGNPTIRTLAKIAKGLGLEVGDLVDF